jgi:hypothetical protein
MRLILTLALLLSMSAPALAQTPDTPANRQAAAGQYVRESALQQVIAESANLVAKGFTPQERAAVLQSYGKHLDVERIRSVMVGAMMQRFTVEEIEAIRKFAGSPAGKSIVGKLGPYSADIVPTIEAASADALGKVLLEMRRKAREAAAEKK